MKRLVLRMRLCRFLAPPSCGGMGPESLLSLRSKEASNGRFPSPPGTLPENKLLLRSKTCKCGQFAISGGIGPENWLVDRLRDVISERKPIEGERYPERLRLKRERLDTRDRAHDTPSQEQKGKREGFQFARCREGSWIEECKAERKAESSEKQGKGNKQRSKQRREEEGECGCIMEGRPCVCV